MHDLHINSQYLIFSPSHWQYSSQIPVCRWILERCPDRMVGYISGEVNERGKLRPPVGQVSVALISSTA